MERLASSCGHDHNHTPAHTDIRPQPQVGLNIEKSTRCAGEIEQKKGSEEGAFVRCLVMLSIYHEHHVAVVFGVINLNYSQFAKTHVVL